jgi:hypothetical protein
VRWHNCQEAVIRRPNHLGDQILMTVGYKIPESDSAPTRAERDHIVDRLQEAVGNGALTLDEFQERLDATYAVVTRSELQSLVADLPPSSSSTPPERPAFHKRGGLAAAAAISVVVVAALVAIGLSHGSSNTPKSPVSIVRDVDSCALLPSAEVDSVLGTASVKPPSRYDSVGYGWDSCTYLTTSDNGPAVDVQAGTAISGFAARYKTTNDDISGIGDQAAIYTNVPGAAVLARQGSKWVDVTVEYLPVEEATPEAESLAKAALHELTAP